MTIEDTVDFDNLKRPSSRGNFIHCTQKYQVESNNVKDMVEKVLREREENVRRIFRLKENSMFIT